jgi:phospholipid/cholesterol/gamma-HCH transport system substrate-binding protein
MRRRHHEGLSIMTVGLIALAITIVAVYLGFTKSIPFRSHFEIKAVFKTGNNLAANSPVRVAGVNVGKVTSVEHAADGGDEVTVTMRVKEEGRPIHKDARLAIRPRIFLEGNFFVDVSPGTPSSPALEDGDVIPVNQTRAPVQLDQLLTALQSDTREDLKVVLKEYASGLKGEGAKGFNRSLRYWEPAYRDGAMVADASLGRAEHDLSQYVKESGAVAAALDRSPEQLKSLISDFNATARGFASESDNLQAAIAELPRTLRAAQPALGALNDSFPSLRAFARDLRPGVESSGPAIDASLPLVRELRKLVSKDELKGLVGDLRPAVPGLATLSNQSVPLYKEVRRLSSCQNEVVIPWSRETVPDPTFPAVNQVYNETGRALTGLAGESRSGDANGQWFRVLVAGGTNLIQFKPGVFATSALPIRGTNPPRPTKRPPLRSDLACETQQSPDLRTEIGDPPPQKRIDTSDPKYVARWTKAQAAAVKWLRGQLKVEGLADEIKVRSKAATSEEIKSAISAALADKRAERAAALRKVKR